MWVESVDSSGWPLATWWLEYPDVDTTDGLWRTTHADTMSPAPSEFNDLPEVWGVAEPIDDGEGDLAFAFYSTAPNRRLPHILKHILRPHHRRKLWRKPPGDVAPEHGGTPQ